MNRELLDKIDRSLTEFFEIKSFEERSELSLTHISYPIYAVIIYFSLIWLVQRNRNNKTLQYVVSIFIFKYLNLFSL